MTSPPEAKWREAGVLVAAHGARDAPRAIDDTEAHVTRLSDGGAYAQIEAGFLTGGRRPDAALDALESEFVYVVPHFMGVGYFVRHALPEVLGLSGRVTERNGRKIYFCDPPSSHRDFPSGVAEICRKQTQSLGCPADSADLLLVAHGSVKSSASATHAAWVQMGIDKFHDIDTAFLEQAPDLDSALRRIVRPTVIAGLFAANGVHVDMDVRAALKARASSTAGLNADHPTSFTGAIGAMATITPLFSAQIAEFDLRYGAACDRPWK